MNLENHDYYVAAQNTEVDTAQRFHLTIWQTKQCLNTLIEISQAHAHMRALHNRTEERNDTYA